MGLFLWNGDVRHSGKLVKYGLQFSKNDYVFIKSWTFLKSLILVHFISSLIDILFVSIFLNIYYWQHDVYILALLWPQQIPASNSKIFKQRRDDEEALQRLNFDQIELEFRNRVSNLPVISVNLYIFLLTLIQEIYWCFLNSFVRQFSFKKFDTHLKRFLKHCNWFICRWEKITWTWRRSSWPLIDTWMASSVWRILSLSCVSSQCPCLISSSGRWWRGVSQREREERGGPV